MSLSLTHHEIEELLGVYALNAVEGDERGAIEGHLRECPRCRAEVSQHLEVAGLLVGGAAAPAALWERISRALEPEAPGAVPERRRSRLGGLRAAAALGAAGVVAVAALGWRLAEQERRLDRVASAIEREGLMRAATAALLDPSAQRVTLRSADGVRVVVAVVLPDGRGYLVQDNLPALPASQTYQLWGLLEDRAVSAGVLGPSFELVAFKISSGVDGLAISEEIAGGVASPEHPPLVMGRFR
jgi:hypothetical protein